MPSENQLDVLILGGGLSGGLLALAFAKMRPELKIAILETSQLLGGNHIWSFFDSDIAEQDRWLVEPLIGHRWSGYDVAFPAYVRGFGAGYNSIQSEQLDAVVRAALGPAVMQANVVEVRHDGVTLSDGGHVAAGAVIDARGPGDLGALTCGWQKFMGKLLTVDGGHGLTRPVVMDATVDQEDGYRFVYLLPFDADRVFVEDTYYSDSPVLDVEIISGRIDDYVAARRWAVSATERVETGVLPVVMNGNFKNYWASTGPGVAKAGVRAGLFHPLTSYSLPDAVAFAVYLAGAYRDGVSMVDVAHNYALAHWNAGRYYRLLTTMLFRAADPAQRYRVLQRFYGLRPALIGRFYAGHSTILDKLRILAGRPPVPVGRAVKALSTQRSKI